MYTYKAMRYHSPLEDQFETLEEAIKRARSDHERDQAWPTEIVDESGVTVIDSGKMDALLGGRPVCIGMTENGQQLNLS